jgi:ATP-binding protein involved in chromosome partitioning
VTAKSVSAIFRLRESNVSVDIELGYPANSVKHQVQQQITAALQTVPGIGAIQVSSTAKLFLTACSAA